MPDYRFKISEVVPASSIWPTTEDHIDYGHIPGLLRGYNIEVRTQKGVVDWMAAAFIAGDPESENYDCFNHDWRIESRKDWGLEPTGRIAFRGYYEEEYDFDERETFVKPATLTDDELKTLAEQYRDR